MGWDCVDASKLKLEKNQLMGYQKHMLTFEHPKYKVEGAEEYPQLLF